MNVLFVVPYVPSLIRVRPYNLIRHLAARGHEITLATVWTNERERQELDAIGRQCASVVAVHLPAWRSLANCMRALPAEEPLQSRYSWSPALQALVSHAAARADLVHVEHLRGATYGLAARAQRPAGGPPIVWDSVDCISHLFEQASRGRRGVMGRLITRLELPRSRRFEGELAQQFDRVLVTSTIDRDALCGLVQARSATTRAPITVLTNGVDLGYFTPADETRQADALVFSGKMSYHANESAVLHLMNEVMPRVWAARPATKLVVVGKDPSRRLRGLLSSEASRVTVTGTVPDIRSYLRRASVAVVPLVYGAGCQNKVLEAMACGTPVVATSQAVSALRTRAERDVLVADSPDAFAGAVLGLLAEPSRRLAIGSAGRRYVETHHRWDEVTARLEEIYLEAIAERQGHVAREQVLSA